MDSNRSKRRSSLPKSKAIRSLYRAATKGGKASSTNSVEYVGPAPVGFIIMNQDQVYPQTTTSKVAFVVSDRKGDSYGKLENFYGGDEGVDAKASKYISSVQERFRLERLNSERENVQDIYV